MNFCTLIFPCFRFFIRFAYRQHFHLIYHQNLYLVPSKRNPEGVCAQRYTQKLFYQGREIKIVTSEFCKILQVFKKYGIRMKNENYQELIYCPQEQSKPCWSGGGGIPNRRNTKIFCAYKIKTKIKRFFTFDQLNELNSNENFSENAISVQVVQPRE